MCWRTRSRSFLELDVLEDGQWPQIINRHIDRNFTVTKLGQNGGAPKKQVVERQTNLQILMERLVTPEYEFPLYNLQVGKEEELENAQKRITYELALKLDFLAKAIIDATVKTSGLRATLNLHPSIQSANIPDANDLDLSGVNTATKWDVEKFKRVLDYVARFTADTSDDLGDLRVKAFFIPSPNLRDIWDFVSLVSAYDGTSGNPPSGVVADPKNTVPSEERLAIYRSGKLEQMFGYKFAIVPRNTLVSGSNNQNYVSTNLPIGYFWTKPSQDSVVLDNSPKMQKANKNSIFMSKTIQMAAMSEWTKNCLRVKV